MRSWSSWTISAALLLALAGCGGHRHWHATFEPSGIGKDQYWTVQANGTPKAVVVLLHGLGRTPASSSSRGRRTWRARGTT